jgi:hypothetical protein
MEVIMNFFIEHRYWDGQYDWRIARQRKNTTQYLCLKIIHFGDDNENRYYDELFCIRNDHYEYLKENCNIYIRSKTSICFKTKKDAEKALEYLESIVILNKITQ